MTAPRILDPAALLVGPRGRRLCLELARRQADDRGEARDVEFAHAAFFAGYELDPGRGTSIRLFGPGASEPVPRPSPGEVARVLDAIEITVPDELGLVRALAGAVDNARYWQEPDGDDVLAAAPEMRDALARVAEVIVAAAPHVDWWSAPFDPTDQWRVGFIDDRRAPPEPVSGSSAAAHLAQWHDETRDGEERAQRTVPRDPRAAWSGPWWSIPPHELTRTTRSLGERGPAGLWFVEDSFGPDDATAVAVVIPREARVYEIDGPDAWAELCRRYPLDVAACRRHDWFRTTGRDEHWVLPDWSAIAAEVDAVHLTVAGYLTTAGRAIAVGEDRFSVLAGWDPGKTVCLTDVETVGPVETWRSDDDGDWSRT